MWSLIAMTTEEDEDDDVDDITVSRPRLRWHRLSAVVPLGVTMLAIGRARRSQAMLAFTAAGGTVSGTECHSGRYTSEYEAGSTYSLIRHPCEWFTARLSNYSG